MRKKKVLLTLAAVAFSAVLAGCAAKMSVGMPDDENRGKPGYAIAEDRAVTLDGCLDETVWKDRPVLSHTESGVTFTMTTYFSDAGLYVGLQTLDSLIYYNKPYSDNKNTAFNIFLLADGDVNMEYRVNVQLDALNTPRAYGLFAFKSAVSVQGEPVNTGESDGMTAELLVPWSEFHLDEKPAFILGNVVYKKVTGLGASQCTEIYPGLSHTDFYGGYYRFDADGYAEADAPDVRLGDSSDGRSKSGGFDLSGLENGLFATNRPGENRTYNFRGLYFKEIYAQNYIVTAKISVDRNAGVGGSSDPLVSIISASGTYGLTSMGLSVNASNTASHTAVLRRVERNAAGWTIQSAANAEYTRTSPSFDFGEGVYLTVIKEGDRFYYVLGTPENGSLAAAESNSLFSGEATPGFLAYNAAAVISDISCRVFDNDPDDLSRILQTLGICKVSVKNSAGGRLTAEKLAVEKGGEVKLDFSALSGAYELTSLRVNGAEYIDRVRADASEGVYTLRGVSGDVEIYAAYAKPTDGSATKFLFDIGGQPKYPQMTIYAEGTTDKSKYYVFRTAALLYEAALPAGTYRLNFVANGFQSRRVEEFVANGNKECAIALERSPYGGTVTVNGKSLVSSTLWDTRYNDQNRVIKPMDATDADIMWLSDSGRTAGDFRFSVMYTITESADPDPNGGFILSDGATRYCVYLLHDGFRVTCGNIGGWQVRGFGAFSAAVGGASGLVGKTVNLSLSRTAGVYSVTASYGGASMAVSLTDLRLNWWGGGDVFALPSAGVGVGMSATVGTAVDYTAIEYTESR